MDNLFDICRSRHRGNEHSEAANRRLEASKKKRRQRLLVLHAVREAGVEGITCKELARNWQVGMNTISGRFSELKQDGLIASNGTTREHSAVMEALIP